MIIMNTGIIVQKCLSNIMTNDIDKTKALDIHIKVDPLILFIMKNSLIPTNLSYVIRITFFRYSIAEAEILM